MNSLTKITDYIISILDSDPLVNTITDDKTKEIDYNGNNQYPIVNIDIIKSIVTENMISVSFQITALNQREYETKLSNSKYYNNNKFDNLNECHTICTRLVNIIRRGDYVDLGIEENGVGDFTFIKLGTAQLLDGVTFNMDITTGNKIPSCYE